MSANSTSPAILIRENTLLPAGSAIESEVFFTGWRIIKNLDRSAFTRNIEGANWYFFYLAGGITATVFGRDRAGTLRRAVKRVLARRDGQKFNSIEITKILSKRFLGIPFMSVTAHFRHIQQAVGLVPGRSFVLRVPPPAPESEPVAGRDRPHTEVATKPVTALISSS
jgi:hypothetical protein